MTRNMRSIGLLLLYKNGYSVGKYAMWSDYKACLIPTVRIKINRDSIESCSGLFLCRLKDVQIEP